MFGTNFFMCALKNRIYNKSKLRKVLQMLKHYNIINTIFRKKKDCTVN